MKKVVVLLSLGVFLTVSCLKQEEEYTNDERDVYVVTYELPDSLSNLDAKLWKNGALHSTLGEMYATSVYVADSNVYVAGFGVWHAMLWKNGKAQAIGPYPSFARSVFVSDNDVYVAGNEYRIKNDETQYSGFAKLWINGVGHDLSDGTYETTANSVYVSGGDVYVVGGNT